MPELNSHLTRRAFTASLGLAPLLRAQSEPPPPNILWITCEDIGPELRCYGDKYADTPNLDKLAGQGTLFRNAWSNAPVCAPARTTIISGMYPPATGSEHMRSMTSLPAAFKMFPCYLREAGYFATNNAKEDYNLRHTGKVWDESSAKAHWRKRPAGKPFFSVFNLMITHESQIRTRPHTFIHDPATAPLPAYHPDTPEVRQDWAQYYDNITTMDKQAGGILRALEEGGLAENTIVFFYGDHGSGMPRSKRWPYNSGLRVPLLVRIPEKYRHLAPADCKVGGDSHRLVAFVDLAPTILSLAGLKPPAHMQGHAWLGPHQTGEQSYLYGFRGRMDERYDMVRSVRDQRYLYIRNYMPHRIYGQHLAYMFETPTTTVWKKMYDEGKLKPPQTFFWEPKPPEELYDLQQDRWEVKNLANSPEHQAILARLRAAQEQKALEIKDVGFLPEYEIHRRSAGSTPYEMGHDEKKYPAKRVIETAGLAASLKKGVTAQLTQALQDPDSAVRWWGALGILMRGAEEVKTCTPRLRKALDDEAPAVRIAAAEALGRYGSGGDLDKSLHTLLSLAAADKNGVYVALMAGSAINELGAKAKPIQEALRTLPVQDPNAPERAAGYMDRLLKDILADLK